MFIPAGPARLTLMMVNNIHHNLISVLIEVITKRELRMIKILPNTGVTMMTIR